MSEKVTIQAISGVADILPDQQAAWEHVRRVAAETAHSFGYQRIDTPMFEATGLFRRGVGDDTDIVQKEMYSFRDLGGNDLTLRPEGTAPVCRAYVEHGMANQPQPVRLYYIAPMFRYERPQSGRYRQHHQFGCEAIGDASPYIDAEIIEIAWSYITRLGIQGVTVRLNSIGDDAERARFNAALKEHFSRYESDLPQLDRDRLRRNPLRLLDSKDPTTRCIVADAPRCLDYLTGDSSAHWDLLLELLEGLRDAYPDFRYVQDDTLVRGLDYYNRTVFEFQPQDVGSQTSLFGGGRYDPLIERIGGDPTPGVGFGSGFERILSEVDLQGQLRSDTEGVDVVTVAIGDASAKAAHRLAAELRTLGLSASSAPTGRSVRAMMRYANQTGTKHALIIGDRELERGSAQLKPLLTDADQYDVPLDAREIVNRLQVSS